MDMQIGHGVEPVERLAIEIGIARERPAVEEARARVADGALDLALRLGTIGAADANAEAPGGAVPQELGSPEHAVTRGTAVLGDDGLQLVEEDLGGHATEEVKGFLKTAYQGAHRLARVKLQPQEARIAEHNDQTVPRAPGKADVGELDLGLLAGQRLEAKSGAPGQGVDRSGARTP
jgi:hypothetical protein